MKTRSLSKLTFLIEDFTLGSPSQQLLDRFLVGWRADGEFHKVSDCEVSVFLDAPNAELDRRVKDFGLQRVARMEGIMPTADATIIVWRGEGGEPNGTLVGRALELAQNGSALFVHGALSPTLVHAEKCLTLARRKKIDVAAGTSVSTTWRLPAVEVPANANLREALIVVQGSFPTAELHALDGLLPLLERRRWGEPEVRRLQFFRGESLWRAADRKDWSPALMAAALSRSDTPQGDSVKDGRTQDLMEPKRIQALAHSPRAWRLDHLDGLRTTILVLDGVVADYNFAIQKGDGSIISSQLYRPPAPGQEHYSRLCSSIEDFIRTRSIAVWQARTLLVSAMLERMGKENPA